MAKILLVTHGQKLSGPNPGLSQLGRAEVLKLKNQLPPEPNVIVCGTGRRHLETALILNLRPTRYSGIIGVPESKNRAANTIILACGTEIPYSLYTTVKDRGTVAKNLINGLPDQTVVITSRSLVDSLGFGGQSQTAALYQLDTTTGKIIELFWGSQNRLDSSEEI